MVAVPGLGDLDVLITPAVRAQVMKDVLADGGLTDVAVVDEDTVAIARMITRYATPRRTVDVADVDAGGEQGLLQMITDLLSELAIGMVPGLKDGAIVTVPRLHMTREAFLLTCFAWAYIVRPETYAAKLDETRAEAIKEAGKAVAAFTAASPDAWDQYSREVTAAAASVAVC